MNSTFETTDYYTIQGWMVQELDMTMTERNVFALTILRNHDLSCFRTWYYQKDNDYNSKVIVRKRIY
jgi:hypothetical protein